jgi:hypothetical protein
LDNFHQISERTFEQEKAFRISKERQFIDDLKRAILNEGNYAASLGVLGLQVKAETVSRQFPVHFSLNSLFPDCGESGHH